MDNRKIASELVKLAKSLTAADIAVYVSIKFSDPEDAATFVTTSDISGSRLENHSRLVQGVIPLRAVERTVKELKTVYGVGVKLSMRS